MRTGYERRLWHARAVTLNLKASELFNMMKASPSADDSLMGLVADTLCSTAELAGVLEPKSAVKAGQLS